MRQAETTSGATETLAGFVERHARQRPNGIAIRYGERQWTWAEWAARIRRAAWALREADVRRGQCVAFLDKNHPACLEILIAAASIGAVTTVVNWRLSGDELIHVLDDCRPRLLFAGAELRPTAEAAAAGVAGLDRIVVVDDDYESLLAAASPVPPEEVDEGDTALVIYSSGTTGRPKGVLLSQRALVNHAANLAPASPFADGDANLVAMPLFHVGGIGYALFGIRAGVPTIVPANRRLGAVAPPQSELQGPQNRSARTLLARPGAQCLTRGGAPDLRAIAVPRRAAPGAPNRASAAP